MNKPLDAAADMPLFPLDAPPASPLATGEAENPNQQTRLSASGARHHGGR